MRVDEMRGYAEWLIDCGKLGDTKEPCAWLTPGSEKDVLPKLFPGLATR